MKTGLTKIQKLTVVTLPQEKLIYDSNVIGVCVRMSCMLSLILVHIIIFIYMRKGKIAQMELVAKEQLNHRLCSYLLQLLCSGPT